MITLEKTFALELLRRHGITVARSAVVDSPEAAVAFASGRPISLFVLESDETRLPDAATSGPLDGTDRIREGYSRLAADAPSGARLFAQESEGPAAHLAVHCAVDDMLGKAIELRSGAHRAKRMCPLGSFEATSMLEELRSKRNPAGSKKTAHMLEHLLVKIAALYLELDAESLVVDPVALRDNHYAVADAIVRVARKPQLTPRLAGDAHDRSAAGMKGPKAGRARG